MVRRGTGRGEPRNRPVRWTWWLLGCLACIGVASGCRSATEEPTSWGNEAVTYLEELSSNYSQDDFYGVLDFYGPGASVEMWRGGFRGGHVVDLLSIGPILDQELFDVHLGVDEALSLIRWPESGKYGAVETNLDDGSIVRETVFDDVLSLQRSLRAPPQVILSYENLYAEFAEAWSSGDTERVAALYGPTATISEPLLGVEVVGRDAIARLALDSRGPWNRIPLTAIDGDAGGGPALYLGPTEYEFEPEKAVGVYQVEDANGCEHQTAVRWLLADGVIVDERRYAEIESFRRCATGELPVGWWTDLDLPGPRDEIATGTMLVAGEEITVHNGTEDLVDLIGWAFERFDSAGLSTPRIESVTFEPSRSCEARSGRVVAQDGSRGLFLCLHERDLCSGQGGCAVPALNARIGALHELSHAWLLDHADGPTQGRFLQLTGLMAWDDRAEPWQERGSEYAAEVLVWGLLDDTIRMVRIGDPPCSELAGAYELLTGSRPSADRSGC